MTTASGGQQTLGKILFYRQLEPLSKEKHGQLGVSNVSNPFSFLADTHLIPLTVDEFGLAAVCYPIIFDTESRTPLAVMGMRGVNVFLGADGSLDPEVYLPAFARRYPFLPIIASQKPGDAPKPEEERVLVCIDRAAKMVSSTPERPFFNGDEPSKYTQEAVQFCREFDMLGIHKNSDHDFRIGPCSLFSCKKTRCVTCPNMKSAFKFFTSTVTKRIHVVNPRHSKVLSCNSDNIIYLITCKRCEVQYVGETLQMLKKRMNGHRNSIRQGADILLAQHFQGPCTLDDLTVQPIEKFDGDGHAQEITKGLRN